MASSSARRAYRWLCGVLGVVFIVAGAAMFVAFFAYHAPGGDPPIPTGPVGYYFIAFAGCATIGWGGGLVGAARKPESGRTIGTASAAALVLMALYRVAGWIMGDYHAWAGDLLRFEAALFLLLALAFVWLRPPHPSRETA